MTTRSVSLEDFPEILRALPEQFTDAAVRGLRSAGARLVGFAVEEITSASPHPAVATGELADSVRSFPVDDGAIVKVTAPHAAPIEEGTRPHYPPIQPIRDWVRTKGFAQDDASIERIARAVARKIARDGIAPRHFFAKAVKRIEPEIPVEIAREFDRIRG